MKKINRIKKGQRRPPSRRQLLDESELPYEEKLRRKSAGPHQPNTSFLLQPDKSGDYTPNER